MGQAVGAVTGSAQSLWHGVAGRAHEAREAGHDVYDRAAQQAGETYDKAAERAHEAGQRVREGYCQWVVGCAFGWDGTARAHPLSCTPLTQQYQVQTVQFEQPFV